VLIGVVSVFVAYNVVFLTCQARKEHAKETKADAMKDYFHKKYQQDTAMRRKLLRKGIDRSGRTKIDSAK
jgi:hypothetical protein